MKLSKARETIKRCRLELEEGFEKNFSPNVYVSMEIGENNKSMKWDICGDGYVEEEYEQLCDLTMLLFGLDGKKPEDYEGKEVDVFIYKENIWAIGEDGMFVIPYWLIAGSEGRILPLRYYTEEEVKHYLNIELPILMGE